MNLRQRFVLLLTFFLSALGLYAANQQETIRRVKYKEKPAFIYRIYLTDKEGTGYSLEHPTRFL